MIFMRRFDIVSCLNEYAFSDDLTSVMNCLNSMIADKSYKEHMDLFFIAISTSQMYGFLSYLSKEELDIFLESDYLRSSSYRGREIPFYNCGQLSFLYELEKNQKVFFSAPTSFGKTSLVNDYILKNSRTLNRILYVVPTNSLLEEIYDKFCRYNRIHGYRYYITTQPKLVELPRTVQILTPERFLLLTERQNIDSFDLIVMDETYKIVESNCIEIEDFVNHRSLRFRKAADIIAQAETRLVFLSPFTYSLTKSMNSFLSKYSIKKIDRKNEYVNREIINVETPKHFKSIFGSSILVKNYNTLAKKVKAVLSSINQESTIVYVSCYSSAYNIASEIENRFSDSVDDTRYHAFLDHIRLNYLIDGNESWSVYDSLKKGIGIYIAPLPRYIKKEIVNLFERKKLTTLLVTTAFTEGVNSCARNLIFTSLVSGDKKNELSDIDVLNVSGRAGRFAKNSVGKVFCVGNKVYDKLVYLEKEQDIKLENYNYKVLQKRLDYEIEMIDDEYLIDSQKREKEKQKNEVEKSGLTKDELKISLNVSTRWKLILYNHFLALSTDEIRERRDQIMHLYTSKEGGRISALTFVFKEIKDAFSVKGEDPFHQKKYDIKPFDKKGEFIWGRLYQLYVAGSPKIIVKRNVDFVQSKFNSIANGHDYTKKSEAENHFKAQDLEWLLKYFDQNLNIKMDTFYSETYKIVSNIIQYKIPFYLVFYVSVFKLFMRKHGYYELESDLYDTKRIIDIFENGDTPEEYLELIDHGLPFLTIEKIKKQRISIDDLKKDSFDDSMFDEYERILIEEIVPLL